MINLIQDFSNSESGRIIKKTHDATVITTKYPQPQLLNF